MSALTLKIRGLKETIQSLGDIDRRKIPFAIEAGLRRSADFVWRELRNNTPVDTGNLKSSNRVKEVEVEGAQAIKIGPDNSIAPYAKWVEWGHHTRSGSWVPGQHYIQNTAIETRNEVQRIFDEALKLALK